MAQVPAGRAPRLDRRPARCQIARTPRAAALQPRGGADELGAPDYVAGRTSDYLIARAATIYGGSQQVQRGIIAKLAFGL